MSTEFAPWYGIQNRLSRRNFYAPSAIENRKFCLLISLTRSILNIIIDHTDDLSMFERYPTDSRSAFIGERNLGDGKPCQGYK